MSFVSRAIERLKTDFHVPIGMAVWLTTTVYHFKTRVDLGPQYVNSIYALYAFLGGHAAVCKWGGGSNGNGNGAPGPQQ